MQVPGSHYAPTKLGSVIKVPEIVNQSWLPGDSHAYQEDAGAVVVLGPPHTTLQGHAELSQGHWHS